MTINMDLCTWLAAVSTVYILDECLLYVVCIYEDIM